MDEDVKTKQSGSDDKKKLETPDPQLVNAEKAEEQIEESSTGPFGWLPRIFKKT